MTQVKGERTIYNPVYELQPGRQPPLTACDGPPDARLTPGLSVPAADALTGRAARQGRNR